MRQLTQPDPRGILALQHLDPVDKRAEEATQAADKQREPSTRAYSHQHGRVLDAHKRPITPTERKLLQALGYDTTGIEHTYVTWISPGVRYRYWKEITES